jgi:hypothetical protein
MMPALRQDHIQPTPHESECTKSNTHPLMSQWPPHQVGGMNLCPTCHLSVSVVISPLLPLTSGIKVTRYNPNLARISCSPVVIQYHSAKLYGLCPFVYNKGRSSCIIMHLMPTSYGFDIHLTKFDSCLTKFDFCLTYFDLC